MVSLKYGDVLYYVYLNEQKIDAIFANLNGSLISEWKVQDARGTKGMGKVGLKIGNILAAIGLGEVNTEGSYEKSYQKMTEVLHTVSIENKLQLIFDYYVKTSEIFTIRFYDDARPTTKVASSKTILVEAEFEVRKLSGDRCANNEERANLLSGFETIFGNVSPGTGDKKPPLAGRFFKDSPDISVSVPFFFTNFRKVQVFYAAFHELLSSQSTDIPGVNLSIIGTWKRKKKLIEIDPIAMWERSAPLTQRD